MKRRTLLNDFANALNASAKPETITATFTNGNKATYTTAIIEMLKTDAAIIELVNDQTGEVIFYR